MLQSGKELETDMLSYGGECIVKAITNMVSDGWRGKNRALRNIYGKATQRTNRITDMEEEG